MELLSTIGQGVGFVMASVGIIIGGTRLLPFAEDLVNALLALRDTE